MTKNEKKAIHRRKKEKTKRENNPYQTSATQYSMNSFFSSPRKRKKVGLKIRHGIFLKKFPNLLRYRLYSLTTKIFEVRHLLTVLCTATWSQLLPSYLNKRKKCLSYKEKGCNTFSLVMTYIIIRFTQT